METKIICWDLDETLGGFRNLDPELKELGLPWGVRHGIHESLARLSAEGFTHVVATSSVEDYAETILKLTGLRDHFAAIFDRETMSKTDWGKTYRPIADHFGLSEEAALERMLVVGDRSSDKPIDINIVFIEHEDGYRYDAVLVQRLIAALLRPGDGSLRSGFEEMLRSAEEIDEGYYTRRVLRVDDQITVKPYYQTNTRDLNVGDEVVPTVDVLEAEDLRRAPLHFEIPPELLV